MADSEPYKVKLKTLLTANKYIGLKSAKNIIGISRSHFYRLRPGLLKEIEDELREQNEKKSLKKKTPRRKGNVAFQADSTVSRNTNFKPITFRSKRAAEKDFVEFVGFRGYYDKKGNPVIDCSYTSKIVHKYDEETGELMESREVRNFRHPYHPGKAHPPPIDEDDTKWGILPHEVDAFHLIRKYLKTGIMFKWPRGFGKTYVACWFIEWSMSRLGYPWLYLSETAIMNDVAFWVWQWAKQNNLIRSASKGDKQNTYTQFELHNGAVLRIFKYLEEKTVGQHGWYLAFDDIIKKKWSEKPSEVKKAKNQWNYSLRYIRRKGLMIFGTRKFQGDPLEHLENMIPDLHIEVKTPYIMTGKFPNWTPKLDAETEREILWVPELYSYDELEAKKVIPQEDGDDPMMAWQAEMMQDPRPTAGKRWKKVEFVKQLRHMNNYDLLFIYIDRATTINLNSDYTGFIQGIREIGTGIRYIENDFTDHIVLEKLLFDVSEFMHNYKMMYKHLICVVIVEKQGGGDDFVSQVNTRSSFEWDGVQIPNYIREICNVLEVHSMGDKKKRIKDRLGAPIDNKRIKFMSYLKNSEIVNNILDYPYNKRIDALDALATGDFKLMEEYAIVERGCNAFEEIEILYKEHEERLRNPVSPLDFENQYLMNLGLRGKRKVFE